MTMSYCSSTVSILNDGSAIEVTCCLYLFSATLLLYGTRLNLKSVGHNLRILARSPEAFEKHRRIEAAERETGSLLSTSRR
jgi:hypothetical protein